MRPSAHGPAAVGTDRRSRRGRARQWQRGSDERRPACEALAGSVMAEFGVAGDWRPADRGRAELHSGHRCLRRAGGRARPIGRRVARAGREPPTAPLASCRRRRRRMRKPTAPRTAATTISQDSPRAGRSRRSRRRGRSRRSWPSMARKKPGVPDGDDATLVQLPAEYWASDGFASSRVGRAQDERHDGPGLGREGRARLVGDREAIDVAQDRADGGRRGRRDRRGS